MTSLKITAVIAVSFLLLCSAGCGMFGSGRVGQLEGELAKANKDLAELQQDRDSLNSYWHNQLDAANRQVGALRNAAEVEKGNLRQQLRAAQTENASAQERLAATERELTEATSQRDKAITSAAKAENAIKALEDAAKTATKEKTQLTGTIADQKRTMEQLSERIRTLEAEIAKLKAVTPAPS
jgi:chromosome segregation ATPase